MLVVMIGIRKSLDLLFTRRELKILDDIMPDMMKRESNDDTENLHDGGESGLCSRIVACCIGNRHKK